MELVDLAGRYRNFYAPSFTVRVAGRDLVRDVLVAVSRVEVELKMGEASLFTLTLSDCYSHKHHVFETGHGDDLLDVLTLGAQVEVCIGYGDAATTPTAILGAISNISTSFPETGAPELVVSGYDHGFALTLGTNSCSWRDSTDSDVVSQLATTHKFNADVEPTTEKHPQIEQHQMSDWAFLQKLAQRNSDDEDNQFEVYMDASGRAQRPTLHFGKPRVKSSPLLRLKWGEGLLSFRPEANLAGQVSKVEVYSWDVRGKQQVVGRASADNSGPKSRSIGQHLGALVRAPDRTPTMRLRQPSFTQAEADKRAKAALGEKAKKFLTGDAEAIGLPELRPDRTVLLDNLGKAFSKPYYIEQASHRIDSSGYRTRFKARETAL
jgi:uncharacterized protein